MTETARFPGTPLIFVHADDASVILLFFHKPPLTPPAKTLLLVPSDKSQRAALDLPAASLGPNSYQGVAPLCPGTANGSPTSFCVSMSL